jgi:hypothetical protein
MGLQTSPCGIAPQSERAQSAVLKKGGAAAAERIASAISNQFCQIRTEMTRNSKNSRRARSEPRSASGETRNHRNHRNYSHRRISKLFTRNSTKSFPKTTANLSFCTETSARSCAVAREGCTVTGRATVGLQPFKSSLQNVQANRTRSPVRHQIRWGTEYCSDLAESQTQKH